MTPERLAEIRKLVISAEQTSTTPIARELLDYIAQEAQRGGAVVVAEDGLSEEQKIEIIHKYSKKEEWPDDGISDDFMDVLRWGLQDRLRSQAGSEPAFGRRPEAQRGGAVVVPPLEEPTGYRLLDSQVWGINSDEEQRLALHGNPVLAGFQAGIRRGYALAVSRIQPIPASQVLQPGMVEVKESTLKATLTYLDVIGMEADLKDAHRHAREWAAHLRETVPALRSQAGEVNHG